MKQGRDNSAQPVTHGRRHFNDESDEEDDYIPERLQKKEKKALMPKRPPPVKHSWCLIPSLLFVAYIISAILYFQTRVEGIISAGWPPYQVFFIVLEWIGVSAFVPYAILLTRGVFPTGSPGLPAAGSDDDERLSALTGLVDGYRMHVRVLIPCYKEPLEVIAATVRAAYEAQLPAHVKRTIYLCDDGKSDDKRAFIESLPPEDIQYVTGRVRAAGEVNGKSANLNNCLKQIYEGLPRDDSDEIDWSEISNKELLVVFDADMCAKQDFFLKILEVMADDNIALCLTPQAFHNIDPGIDLFNAINCQFWEYWLPGAFAWGYIACTGTNFCLRVRPLAHCGWFPEYTITEDYALGMELKSRGYKATYLMDYIAAGEAPEEIRNVLRQRSRWTKGHYQVFFSRRNSLINWDLPFFQRLWYAYAAWSPFCTTLTVPGFMVAPLISVIWGIHPLVINYNFVLYSTIYFFIQMAIQFYCRRWMHLKLMWYVNMSNVVLWFTYTKAFWNSVLGALGLKAVMFKVTDKVVKSDAATAQGGPHESSGPAPPPLDENMVQRVARVASVTVRNVSSRIMQAFTPRRNRADSNSDLDRYNSNMQCNVSHTAPGAQAHRHDDVAHQQQQQQGQAPPKPAAQSASLDVKFMDAPRLPGDEDVQLHMPPMAVGQMPSTPPRPAYDAPFEFDSPGPSASMIQHRPPALQGDRPGTTRSPTTIPTSHGHFNAGGPSGGSAATGSISSGLTKPKSAKVVFADADMYAAPVSRGPSMMSDPSGVTVNYMNQPPAKSDRSFMRDFKSMFGENKVKARKGEPDNARAPAGLKVPLTTPHDEDGDGAGKPSAPAATPAAAGNTAAAAAATYPGGYTPMMPVMSPNGVVTMMPVVQYPGAPATAAAAGGFSIPAVMPPGVVHGSNLMISNPFHNHNGNNEASIKDQIQNAIEQHKKSEKEKKKSRENMVKAGKERFLAVLESFKPQNVSDFGKMVDPLALFCMWAFNIVCFALAIWQLVLVFNQPTVAAFALKSPLSGNPYLLIAALWSLYNSVAPYLFIHYCFSSGASFRWMTKYLPTFSTAVMITGVVMLWLMIPSDVKLDDALDASLNNFLPSQVVNDTNTHFLYVTGTSATPVALSDILSRSVDEPIPFQNATNGTTGRRLSSHPTAGLPPNLLGGIMAGPDHVKSIPPLSHALTWLTWGALSFPAGYSPLQMVSLMQFIKTGADYIIRSNLNVNNPDNPVFVAQVGDPNDYVVIDEPGYDPKASGKIWTTPDQDPYLAGHAPRKAWLLTRETPGADLLADAAAALAAASVIMKERDPGFAALALKHARYLYSWATKNVEHPVSYCEFIPCTSTVKVKEQRNLKPVPQPAPRPLCWYADWTSKICKVGWTDVECNNVRRMNNDVFLQKAACCSALKTGNAWSGLYTGAQGLCALPDDQWTCYTPDMNQRTCYAQAINKTTGLGCSGVSMEIFNSPLSCCNYLQMKDIIDLTGGKAATGMCARTGTDQGFKKCYVPNLVNATCDYGTGSMCETFGVVTSFDSAVACCNNLAKEMKSTAMIKVDPSTQLTLVSLQGICEPHTPSYSPLPVLNALGTFVSDPTPPGANTDSTTLVTSIDPVAVLGDDALNLNGVIDTLPAPVRKLLDSDAHLHSDNEARFARARALMDEATADASDDVPFGEVNDVIMEQMRAALKAAEAADAALHAGRTGAPITDFHAPTRRSLRGASAHALISDLASTDSADMLDDMNDSDTGTGRRRLSQTGTDLTVLTQLLDAIKSQQGSSSGLAGVPLSSAPNYSDNTTYWPLPVGAAFLEDPCAKPGSCELKEIERTVNVTFFNSTSVMDNLAWAAVWMYKASRESKFMGDAQYWIERHYHEELPSNIFTTDRSVYKTDWDNQAWGVNLMLANLTGSPKYEDRVRQVLTVWLFGDAVPSKPPPGLDEHIILNGRVFDNITLSEAPTKIANATNVTYYITPDCVPTNIYEQNCFDGKDDDCNGLIDREDLACGLFPVTYTPMEIAWAAQPSLPLAANKAFMAMVYGDMVAGSTQTRLRCWALSQVGHMLGSGSQERSYVVGVGKNPPKIIQHRQSSCPESANPDVNNPSCDWSSGFFPYYPNPRLNVITGALISGPDNKDNLQEVRMSEGMKVTVHDNAGFLGALAALTATDTRVRSCESFHGVFQRYISNDHQNQL